MTLRQICVTCDSATAIPKSLATSGWPCKTPLSRQETTFAFLLAFVSRLFSKMLAAASVTDAHNLLQFKYQTSPTTPTVVHVLKKARGPKSSTTTPVISRAASSSEESINFSERPFKRKSPTDDDLASLVRGENNRSHTRSKKLSSRSTPEPKSGLKRSRSARLGSRWHSREPTDYLYTPPPKRARSDQPFGSKEKPIPRTCSTIQDGRVDQYTSDDVIRRLLPTYKSCASLIDQLL